MTTKQNELTLYRVIIKAVFVLKHMNKIQKGAQYYSNNLAALHMLNH